MKQTKRLLAQLYLWLLLTVLYAPILIIAIFSFTEAKVLGNWTGFSTRLYASLFSAGAGSSLSDALWNTLLIALVAAALSTLLGTLAAVGIAHMRPRQRRCVSFLNSIPMINPDIITGISIFLLFVFLGVSRGMPTIIAAHVAFCTPYVVLCVMPRLRKMNPNIYEAALDLGATPAQAFRKVLLPELKPGMISGFILAVTLSVDDFAVTLFTKGSSGIDTLSTYIYADARKGGLTPELRPLSTLIFLCILALLIVINARSAKQARPAARPSSRSKKPLAAAALLLAALTLPAQARADVPRSQVLKVYNWADYIDEDLIPEFEAWYEARTGEPIHVLYETFDVNENMLTEIEMGHEDYDCVCPSEYIIERMLRADLLLPLCRDFDTVPDYTSLVSPFALEKFEQMGSDGHRPVRDYAVGYMWGTTGFLYNTAYVSADRLSSWGALVDPDFRGRIFMKDAFRDIYSTLILYARYDDILAGRATRDSLVAHTTDENIAAVERVLTAAKPNIAGWEVDFGKEMMTKGKAWINVSWSGDAMWAIEEGAANGVTLDYVVPREGSNVWFDGWVIPRYARNPRAAAYFINFLCRPDNAIRNMEAIGYVSVIASPEIMEAMADPDQPRTYDLSYFFGDSIGADTLRVNPIMYPDRTVVDRCALMHDCADRTEAMLEMWSRVKGDNLNWPMLVVVLLVVAAYVAYRVRRSLRRRRSRRRRLNRRRIG